MNADLSALTLLALPVSLVLQWWILRRRWLSRVHAAQARHARYKARAEVLIAITKQQMNSLQRQVTGGRPVRKRPENPYPVALMRARRQRSAPDDAQLIVVDEDGASAQLPPCGPEAFADTVAAWELAPVEAPARAA